MATSLLASGFAVSPLMTVALSWMNSRPSTSASFTVATRTCNWVAPAAKVRLPVTGSHCWVVVLKNSSGPTVSTPGVAAFTGSLPASRSSWTVTGPGDGWVRLTVN